jgi:hypothetical protein
MAEYRFHHQIYVDKILGRALSTRFSVSTLPSFLLYHSGHSYLPALRPGTYRDRTHSTLRYLPVSPVLSCTVILLSLPVTFWSVVPTATRALIKSSAATIVLAGIVIAGVVPPVGKRKARITSLTYLENISYISWATYQASCLTAHMARSHAFPLFQGL